MQRKHFLATAGVTASLAAVAAIAAAPMPNAPPYPGYSPVPGRSPRPIPSASGLKIFHRHGKRVASDLEHIHRRLEHLIDMLEEYQGQNNSSHVSQAIGFLQQADSEVVAQLAEASPTPTL